MSETGVVKFACEHVATKLASFAGMEELNVCRGQLLARGWLGVDAQGIGFGNLSVRDGTSGRFFITASGTGGFAELTLEHYARVTEYDLQRNWLQCEGAAVASSESLTHAAIYGCASEVRAVLHCHAPELWRRWREVAPTTAAAVEYGTPAMAGEVRRLFRETHVLQRSLFVMGGHENGVVAFGAGIADAMAALDRSTANRVA
ncbi:MAG: class II aldolase/adducin family protein [Chthoniobacterales bacterium]